MNIIYCLLLLAGVICFFASTWSKRVHNIDLVAVGLGLVFLVPLIQHFRQI